MRLTWILGQVGIQKMNLIIGMSSTLLLITSLSLATTLSNMKMEGGGSYYLISRSLGIEFGSAIGILISISQLVSIALCVTGFALSLHEFLPNLSIPVLEVATLSILMAISFISTELALKAQVFIFVTLAISLGAIFTGGGAHLPATLVPLENLDTGLTFWAAFALFFPATTGIEAGLSMSGDLKKPSRSIPVGTLASVLAAFGIYMGLTYFCQSQVSKELLKSYPFIVYHLTKYGQLVLLGVWGATLSSALGSILSGPRIIEAIAEDGILPRFLVKPLLNNLVMFGGVVTLLLTTDINQILPILTMTCLMTYGLINFVAFFENLVHNPSYRPTFRLSKMIPLVGAVGCLMAMFMINAGAAFVALALTIGLCIWTSSRKVSGNFEDLRYSLCLYFINRGILALSNLEKNARSWRPHILSFVNGGTLDKNLAFFSDALNQDKGFLTFAVSTEDLAKDREVPVIIKNELKLYQIPSYVHINPTHDLEHSQSEILTNYGLGPLKPNTTLCLFESLTAKASARFLRSAHSLGKNTILLKADPVSTAFYQPSETSKQINLWWGGEYRGNFELCLALSHLLQMSEVWSGAHICINTVVVDEEMCVKKTHQFERFSEKLRLENLAFHPIIDPNQDFFTNLREHSTTASLTFLGIRAPQAGETEQAYHDYLKTLYTQTETIPNVAYVLSGETLDFEKIFFQ